MMLGIMSKTSRSSTPSNSKKAAPAGQSHVALLRGINVGGKNKLPMKELAAMFAAAGCGDVRTYVQSGNVVFTAADVAGLDERLAGEIAARFGIRVPVVLRSASAMQAVVKGNPFLKAGVAEEGLHVYFLACAAPAKEMVKALDYERSPGDSYVVSGREIYLHLPNGVARTKLTNAYFDKQFGTVSTLRNWRTVVTLAEWAGSKGYASAHSCVRVTGYF
jgi:uncharacterized protein (DUF1697 family)